MRALIVEDNFTNRKILQRFLKDISETDIAVDGLEAVTAFKSALDDDIPYDVIFLDIMMPHKDGMQVLREIRQYEQEHGINGLDGVKVIMTSALEGNHDILNAFKAGCEAYIVKPYTRRDINMKLAELGCLQGVT